jgi:predicted permease
VRNDRWIAWLGRRLPEHVRRDWFDPSIHDLRAAGRDTRLRTLATCAECLRLLALERVRQPRVHKERMAMFLSDLRQALRLFRREPGFMLAAVITLALGIGANTAVFAVVEAVLLRPLPYGAADELVLLRHRDTRTGLTKYDLAIGDFIDLRARMQTVEALVAHGLVDSAILGEGDPLRVQGTAVNGDLLAALRVTPISGRSLTADDARQGAEPVMMIGEDLWRTRFGSRPDVVGQSVQIGQGRRVIVGVAPAGFRFPPGRRTDVLVPQTMPPVAPAGRKNGWAYGVARRKAGVTLAGVNAELRTLSEQFAQEYPTQNQGSQYYAEDLRASLVGDTRRPLLLLLGAVGFVLLIACVNVANLLLARSLARRDEMAVRLALGAGRGRLVAQLLTESFVLGVAGGLAGLAIAWRGSAAVVALVPQAVTVPGLEQMGINLPVLAFATGASVLSATLFGLIAGVAATSRRRGGAVAVLRRTTADAGTRRAAAGLVAVEIALAVVLLFGAGLTLRSFARLLTVDPGFRTDRVAVIDVGLPPGRYPTEQARRAFFDRLFAAVQSLPGVEAAGGAQVTPLTGNNWTVPFQRADQPIAEGERPPDVGWQVASAGFFRALDIPLRAGRMFDERDTPDTPRVVIVSEAIASRFFPGESPVGRQVRLGKNTLDIVGVVGDIRRAALATEPIADMYFPFEQGSPSPTSLFVRTAGSPTASLPAVQTRLRELEPNMVIRQTRTMAEVASESVAVTRLALWLLGACAAIALALAAIGIYGVMAYSVRQRTREIGTRAALGADRRTIVRLVMRQGALMTAVGLAAGAGVALASARALSSILFDVPPWDPITLASAALLLVTTAMAACYLPARRAAAIDPARTLAAE